MKLRGEPLVSCRQQPTWQERRLRTCQKQRQRGIKGPSPFPLFSISLPIGRKAVSRAQRVAPTWQGTPVVAGDRRSCTPPQILGERPKVLACSLGGLHLPRQPQE